MSEPAVLLVEDEETTRGLVRRFLAARGLAVEEAGSCAEALRAFHSRRLDAAVIDHLLPDGTALELLPRLRAIDPDVPLVVLTGHGSIDLAVQAVKAGAEQFLTKPVELEALALVLERLIAAQKSKREAAAGRRRDRQEPDPFLGKSPAVRRLAEEAARAARVGRPLLLLGETGAGKGILASWLWRRSPRSGEAFVDLNCAGLPRDLVESELFGHARGAFTGAATAKPGLLEVAHRGTLFLDEVGDLDLAVQPKLLKVLEEGRLRRLGEVGERRIDVQLIVATHRDLERMVREDRFRGDLYFRISTLTLRVPPLRERPEDIRPLAEALLARQAAELGHRPVRLSESAVEVLEGYDWPGNIRELRNVLERAVLLHDLEVLEPKHLRVDSGARPGAGSGGQSLADLEWEHIQRVLREEDGNVPRAARRLGVSRSGLFRKLKRGAPGGGPDG
jgi:DNA-binding NtrC family response regulator